LTDDPKHFIQSHRFRSRFVRRFTKSAVAAEITAQICERDKNLWRKGNYSALVLIAHRGRSCKQAVKFLVVSVDQSERFVARNGFPRETLFQQLFHYYVDIQSVMEGQPPAERLFNVQRFKVQGTLPSPQGIEFEVGT
jgi:hypothetical protein